MKFNHLSDPLDLILNYMTTKRKTLLKIKNLWIALTLMPASLDKLPKKIMKPTELKDKKLLNLKEESLKASQLKIKNLLNKEKLPLKLGSQES